MVVYHILYERNNLLIQEKIIKLLITKAPESRLLVSRTIYILELSPQNSLSLLELFL